MSCVYENPAQFESMQTVKKKKRGKKWSIKEHQCPMIKYRLIQIFVEEVAWIYHTCFHHKIIVKKVGLWNRTDNKGEMPKRETRQHTTDVFASIDNLLFKA